MNAVAAKKRAAVPSKVPRVRQRAKRVTPNLSYIVEVTAEMLEKQGEAAFRIEDMMERTGVSKSSLYLRFKDRDGLLAAAYGHIFQGIVAESITALEFIVHRATDTKSLRSALHAATSFVSAPDRHSARIDRAAIIAGTRGRPQYRAALAEAQASLTERMVTLIEFGKKRGLIRLRHPSRTTAHYLQAVTFGLVIAEIEQVHDPVDSAAWVALINETIDHLFFSGLIDE